MTEVMFFMRIFCTASTVCRSIVMVKTPAVFLLVISFTLLMLYAVNWTSRILHSLFHLATFLIKPLICNFSDSNNCLYCTVKCVKTEYYTAAGFSLLNRAQR